MRGQWAHAKPIEKIWINESLHLPKVTTSGTSGLCRIVLLPLACRNAVAERTRHSPGFGIATQIVRCQLLDSRRLGAVLYYVPDDPL
jgi:hypothetical protein